MVAQAASNESDTVRTVILTGALLGELPMIIVPSSITCRPPWQRQPCSHVKRADTPWGHPLPVNGVSETGSQSKCPEPCVRPRAFSVSTVSEPMGPFLRRLLLVRAHETQQIHEDRDERHVEMQRPVDRRTLKHHGISAKL